MNKPSRLNFVLFLFVTVLIRTLFAQDVTVRIDPSQKSMAVGDTTTLQVKIDNVTNLGAFEFTIAYNGGIVHVESVQMGDFLGSTGRTVIPTGPNIDDYGGTVIYGGASLGTNAGPDGSGVLASVVFSAQGAGTTALNFTGVTIADINGQEITVNTLVSGGITVDGDAAVEGVWFTQSSGSASRLYTVHAVSDQIGWASGGNGTVLRTTDGGASWTHVGAGIDADACYSIVGIDANTAIVAGAVQTMHLAKTADYHSWFKRTTDAGGTWTSVHEGSGWLVNRLTMFDNLNGMANGDPVNGVWSIMKTTDGGLTWTQLPRWLVPKTGL